ncbi:hypothetical protein D3C76_910010 [compost metagenome]
MAQRVVDPLEAIQVHVHQGAGFVRALVAQQHAFGRLVEAAPIEQAGERVGHRLVLELLVQVAHDRHVQHGDHHGPLIGRQRCAGQRHGHQFPAGGAQLRVVHAKDPPGQVRLVEIRIGPQASVGHLHQVEQLGALQQCHRRFHQPRNGRIGKADGAGRIHHQDAFGSVFQNGSVECPGSLQFAGQALQHAPVTLLIELGLHLGLENLWVERLEQVIHRATGVALEHSGIGLFIGGQEDDRGQPGAVAATHQPGDFEAVHFRHLHIQQDQVDFMFKQRTQGFGPRACG